MPTYITQNSRYPVEVINGYQVIRSRLNMSIGEPYAILGCYDPRIVKFENLNKLGKAKINGVTFSLDELAAHLDQEIKIGTKIVARQLTPEGNFAPFSHAASFVTSQIKSIEV